MVTGTILELKWITVWTLAPSIHLLPLNRDYIAVKDVRYNKTRLGMMSVGAGWVMDALWTSFLHLTPNNNEKLNWVCNYNECIY